MKSIISSINYKNKACNYINETFIYKNKACVYRLYRMVGKFTLGS